MNDKTSSRKNISMQKNQQLEKIHSRTYRITATMAEKMRRNFLLFANQRKT
jgi:hypothetical protein